MTRKEKPNETPRKEKMQEALAHYDDIATKACWHRSDIPEAIRAYYASPSSATAEGAKTCWNCGIELRYSPNGVTAYHCSCGAVNPGERQQPTAEGAEEILAKVPYVIKHNIRCYEHDDVIPALKAFATLHAQQIADKMVEEELVTFLIKRDYPHAMQDECVMTMVKHIVDEYLKSREK